ncbi:MAG TPA: DUF6644 family protein [Bryobacteraceae bacterium]|nr:DUF6644 family protein [Bryobacteraceae bacterium]
MPVPQFFQWLGTSPLANAMNGPEWAFPVVECFHFIGFALLIGTIAIVDLRLLGGGMRRQTPAELAQDLQPWTLTGLVFMLTTGPAMFAADPGVYYVNPSFRFKITCLVVAILYQFTIHRWAVKPNVAPIIGKIVAVVSLALWISVLGGGRMIAFV